MKKYFFLTPFESRLESISCSSVVAPSSEWHWWQCMMLKFTDYQTHYLANLTDLSYIHYTYRKYRLYMDFLPMPTSLNTSYLLFLISVSTEYPCLKLSSKETSNSATHQSSTNDHVQKVRRQSFQGPDLLNDMCYWETLITTFFRTNDPLIMWNCLNWYLMYQLPWRSQGSIFFYIEWLPKI